MKKSIWLAIIGAAALTGCQSEVMQQREYVPAPREDVEPAQPAQPAQPISDPYAAPQTTEIEPVRTRENNAPAPSEYRPMDKTFANDGVSEDAPLYDKNVKKGAKQGGKPAAAGEYVVKENDTLGQIALAHGVRLGDLMKANNLKKDDEKKLRPGRKLVIPARRRGGAPGRRGVTRQTAGPGEYIVKEHDTLGQIAQAHGVRLGDLMKANNLKKDDEKKLRPGRKLVIPGRKAARGAAKDAGRDAGRDAARSGGSGKRSTGEVAGSAEKLNLVPVDGGYAADVPRDMKVAEFAALAGVTEEQLRELNPHMPADRLKKDSTYIIPRE